MPVTPGSAITQAQMDALAALANSKPIAGRPYAFAANRKNWLAELTRLQNVVSSIVAVFPSSVLDWYPSSTNWLITPPGLSQLYYFNGPRQLLLTHNGSAILSEEGTLFVDSRVTLKFTGDTVYFNAMQIILGIAGDLTGTPSFTSDIPGAVMTYINGQVVLNWANISVPAGTYTISATKDIGIIPNPAGIGAAFDAFIPLPTTAVFGINDSSDVYSYGWTNPPSWAMSITQPAISTTNPIFSWTPPSGAVVCALSNQPVPFFSGFENSGGGDMPWNITAGNPFRANSQAKYPVVWWRETDPRLIPGNNGIWGTTAQWASNFFPVGWFIYRVDLHRTGASQDPIPVRLGCVRNGGFASFGTFNTGQTIFPMWPVMTKTALCYDCDERIDVQAAVVTKANPQNSAFTYPLRARYYNLIEAALASI